MHDERDVEEMRRAMADATATIPIADIRRLDVHPGDTLVVRAPHVRLTRDVADQIERRLLGLIGDGVKVIVMPDDTDITVVRGAGA